MVDLQTALSDLDLAPDPPTAWVNAGDGRCALRAAGHDANYVGSWHEWSQREA